MNNPIGIFDSGIGGLSVWREVKKLLPNEDIIYVADSKHCPYGEKKPIEINERSSKITQFLIDKGCKVIVVACNTATAASIAILREKFNIPFIGMEPAIKPAAIQTQTGKIGILATEGTFKGELFQATKNKYAQNIEAISQPGYGLVELVELNLQNTEDAKYLLKKYIDPMLNEAIDHLVLGCTHYPFFIDALKSIIPEKVTIINPAPAIAQRTLQILSENNLLNENQNEGNTRFISTGNTNNIKIFLSETLNTEANIEHLEQ